MIGAHQSNTQVAEQIHGEVLGVYVLWRVGVEKSGHATRHIHLPVRCYGRIQLGRGAVDYKGVGTFPALQKIGDEEETRWTNRQRECRGIRRNGHKSHFCFIAVIDEPYS